MSKLQYDIVFDHEQFVAVCKPSGMLTIPDRAQSEPSLKDLLMQRYGSIYTVHRLDKDTSGLILFAKTEETHHYLCQLFENREVEKFYLGIVKGKLIETTGIIEAPITEHPTLKGTMVVHRIGKPSTTGFEVLDSNNFFSMVKFQLFTGRTHQIRVHSKHIGHPLACDPLYGDGATVKLSAYKKNYKLSKNELEERPMISRLALHAFQLRFKDASGKLFDITAPAPKEFVALMKQLGK